MDAVIFGAPDLSFGSTLGEGRLFALNAATGAEIWKSGVVARLTGTTGGSTVLHEQIGYSSPVVAGNRVYIGVANHCDNPIQKGRVVAVRLADGVVDGSFSYCGAGGCADNTRGGGVWSSVAAFGDLYITTGNSNNGGPEPSPNHGLSMLRLNAGTGAIVWKFQPVPYALGLFGSAHVPAPTIGTASRVFPPPPPEKSQVKSVTNDK